MEAKRQAFGDCLYFYLLERLALLGLLVLEVDSDDDADEGGDEDSKVGEANAIEFAKARIDAKGRSQAS